MNNEFNQAERDKPAQGGVGGLSIPQLATESGIDAFALYALIQDGRVKSNRTPGGSLYLAKPEADRLLNGVCEDPETEGPC